MSLFFVPTCPVNVSRETFEIFKKECAKAHSRAEARLLRQPSPLRRVRILAERFYFIGRLFL
jgi:hypothetical protein